jgi:beta-phosphoglucomutase
MTDPRLSRIRAVIFDFDGVLVDSMQHHVDAWQAVFREYGVELSPQEILEREGEKARLTTSLIARKHGIELDDDEVERLIRRKRKIYRAQAKRRIRPSALTAVLECRQRGYKTAIVTGSVRDNLEWALPPEELALFDAIITADAVRFGKPHPEPFLAAAEKLGLSPQECLVIENAPLGIRSAKAAGMKCIAITTTLPADRLQEADLIIPDLDALWSAIKASYTGGMSDASSENHHH